MMLAVANWNHVLSIPRIEVSISFEVRAISFSYKNGIIKITFLLSTPFLLESNRRTAQS